jgi:hypothetical protein
VYSPSGTNHTIELLLGTFLYDLKQANMPATADVDVRNRLRLFAPAAALVRVPEAFFSRYPIETQVALSRLADAADVLRHLLGGGRTVKAGHIAGALRRLMIRPRIRDLHRRGESLDCLQLCRNPPFTRVSKTLRPRQPFGVQVRFTSAKLAHSR